MLEKLADYDDELMEATARRHRAAARSGLRGPGAGTAGGPHLPGADRLGGNGNGIVRLSEGTAARNADVDGDLRTTWATTAARSMSSRRSTRLTPASSRSAA